MYRSSARLAIIVTAAVAAVAGVGPILGQDAPNSKGVDALSVSGAPDPVSRDEQTFGTDDRLKISFFEAVDVARGKPDERRNTGSEGFLRTFYQRMDLSGDYTVGPDGAISIPLLGRFPIDGRSLEEVRSQLMAAFSSLTGRTADVSVTIAERPPIYVVGPVKNPGAYKYVPGMMVLQAIALAGGYDRGESGLTAVIEGVRQMEQYRKASDQVQRLQARRVRLEAQRNGLRVVPIPIQLSTPATGFMSIENTLLQAEAAKREGRESELAGSVLSATKEVDALKHRLTQADAQRNMRIERLDDMQKLKDRGVVSNNSVITLRTELSDIEARREEYVVAVIQAETRLAQAKDAKSRFMLDEAEGLVKDIAAIDQQLAEARNTIASSEALAAVLLTGRDKSPQSYQILRRSRDGSVSLAAAETTALRPGDVLKIGAASANNTP
jgi:protein involved in polysaccharide export with SLBB domain